jgi:hypothetical protein
MKERRNHKIKSDFGIKDYYAYYRETGGTCDYKTYKEVLVTFFDKLTTYLVENEYSYKLPARMGIITILKVSPKIKMVDGGLRTNMAVNFKATNELWESDPEAKKNKVKIYYENKHSNRYRYKFEYSKSKATYKNKKVYKFRLTRTNKYKLRDYIFKHGEVIKSEKLSWK